MPNGGSSKGFLIALVLLIALVAGIPLVLSQSQVQQIFSGNAWYTSQSASSTCDATSAKALIKVSFTNKESSKAMNVAAVDQQSGKSVDLGKIDAGKTKTGEINTQRDSLNSGFVSFKLTWSDGSSGTDSRNAGYLEVSTCTPSTTPTTANPSSNPSGSVTPPSGTVTPSSPPDQDETITPTYPPNSTITPSPNTTTTPTPSPTKCPTPGTVKNIKIQCPYCTPNPVLNK